MTISPEILERACRGNPCLPREFVRQILEAKNEETEPFNLDEVAE